jgi:S-formylglutathione hydrolase FrmB
VSTQTDITSQRTTEPSRSQPRSWRRILVGAAITAMVAVALALALPRAGHVWIMGGWFPVVLFGVTVAACVTAVVLRRDVLSRDVLSRDVLREFAIGVPIGIVVAVPLVVVLHLTQTVPIGASRSVYVWLCVACLMAGLVLAGWRRAHWPRRICGVVAVVLAVVSAGSAVNQTFGYYPTVDRLLSPNANYFLSNPELNAIRAQVAKTGQLPDHGVTLTVSIPGTNLKFTPRQAYVWVPPAWFARNRPQLPVIELLHGTPGEPSNWIKGLNADVTALAFEQQHHGVAPILVVPDINGSYGADSECVNSAKYGAVETYLAQTVPQFMRNNFNASTAPGSVAVAGLSEGGLCATTLALNNPKVYAAFGNYSGDASPTYQDDNEQQSIQILFGGSPASYNAHNPPYILTHQRFTGLAGWFAAGAQDPQAVQAAQALAPLSSNAGIDTCLTTPPGRHSFDFWTQAFSDSLPWLSWKLKLTPEPVSIPAQCVSGKS